MDDEGFDLVSLLCSRLCHDLVSPVGAVNNGLEVLSDESDAEMREMAMRLITQSAERAANKLEFARLAYGAAGGPDAVIDLTQARKVTAALLKDHQVNLDWQCNAESAHRLPAKLLVNGALLAAEALPRGGNVSAFLSQQEKRVKIRITAEGSMLRPLESMAEILEGEIALAGLAPRLVQAYFTGMIARFMNGKLLAEIGPERIILHGNFAG
ncbi:MAG: histidine phosphotransferase family protein [Pseudomonadota bacterium]|jgi:histidine phosphotransferase ChpT|nr:histidine phosphotransferase [Alphaproteobacteria bacterium]